jgi:hypothetical protein
MWFLTVKIFLYIKWKIRKLERKVWSWMGGAQLEGSHSPWELRNGDTVIQTPPYKHLP